MRSLLISSLLVALAGCGSAYKTLQPAGGDRNCVEAFRPVFGSDLYKAQVEVAGKNLSGLLLIKTMEDSSIRVVFSTETGVKFFDFEFGSEGAFRAHHVMKKLDKKIVVNALRNDFDLVLMNGLGQGADRLMRREYKFYHGFQRGKKTAWYVTDAGCATLQHAELGSRRKLLVDARLFAGEGKLFSGGGQAPDSVSIRHHNFNFNIALKKLER